MSTGSIHMPWRPRKWYFAWRGKQREVFSRDCDLPLHRADDRHWIVHVPGTNENTFALARELVLAGADPAHCARGIYFAHSVAKIRLLGEALRNLTWKANRLRLGDAGTDGTLRRQGRRLRRIGELRSFDRWSRSGGVFPRVARRAIPRQPAQQRQTRRRSRGRNFGGGGHECASGCSVEVHLPRPSARFFPDSTRTFRTIEIQLQIIDL